MSQPNVAPRLILGDAAVDDRGEVTFVNDWWFDGVKRFYVITNHRPGFVRAWHDHKREAKYIHVIQGAAIVGLVAVENWDQPSRTLDVHRYVLSSRRPAVLCAPPGYANGIMSLSGDTKVVVFSTMTLEESLEDDYRFDARLWDIWSITDR